MANIKQQIKRNKTNENKDKAVEALQFAYKKLDKALAKGIYHKNYVARHKSHLAQLVNSL